MICLKLLILLLVLVVVVQSDWISDEYIIFSLNVNEDNNKEIAFYKMNFSLKNATHLNSLGNPSGTPEKLFIRSNAIYWKNRNSDLIVRFDLSTNNFHFATITGVQDSVFVGPDSDNNLYIYSNIEKTISVHTFENPLATQKVLKGMKNVNNSHFIGRDPCNKDRIYFLQCSPKISVISFDLKKDEVYVMGPTIEKCSENWGITPNGEKNYFLAENIFYEGTKFYSFKELYQEKSGPIKSFAVGNNELFFSIGETGIVTRFTENCRVGEEPIIINSLVQAKGEISAMAVHQRSAECWTPVD